VAFKDINCTCDGYCRCDFAEPCVCKSMARDPHCGMCLQHLTPGQERMWRTEMFKDGIDPDNWGRWEAEYGDEDNKEPEDRH
jgi:hypothetical protein